MLNNIQCRTLVPDTSIKWHGKHQTMLALFQAEDTNNIDCMLNDAKSQKKGTFCPQHFAKDSDEMVGLYQRYVWMCITSGQTRIWETQKNGTGNLQTRNTL